MLSPTVVCICLKCKIMEKYKDALNSQPSKDSTYACEWFAGKPCNHPAHNRLNFKVLCNN